MHSYNILIYVYNYIDIPWLCRGIYCKDRYGYLLSHFLHDVSWGMVPPKLNPTRRRHKPRCVPLCGSACFALQTAKNICTLYIALIPPQTYVAVEMPMRSVPKSPLCHPCITVPGHVMPCAASWTSSTSSSACSACSACSASTTCTTACMGSCGDA